MNKPFIPSSWLLTKMIEAAMAKADANIKRQREEHFERAVAINARKIREEREHNCRRYVYAGDRP